MSAKVPAVARYAAVFREAGSPKAAGAVIVSGDRVRLEGRCGAETVELEMDCGSLEQVRIGRAANERLNGRPTIVLSRRDGPDVQIEPLRAGILSELIDLLVAVPSGLPASDRVVVRVPLKQGGLARARTLVEGGPPFDPAELGLERHEVYLGAGEALFVLEGRRVRERLAQAVREPSFWRAGLVWRRLLDGAPSLVSLAAGDLKDRELIYSWPPQSAAG